MAKKTTNVMDAWTKMPIGTFFEINGEVFKKNTPSTALYINQPGLGEMYIGPMQARAIKPYTPTQQKKQAAKPQPRDPEEFETKEVKREPVKPNYGATEITVTPVETSEIEQGIQPAPSTGKHKKSKK